MHFCLSHHAHSTLHFTKRSSIPRSQLTLNNHFSVVNPSTTEGGAAGAGGGGGEGGRGGGSGAAGGGGGRGGKGCECDPVTYSMSPYFHYSKPQYENQKSLPP